MLAFITTIRHPRNLTDYGQVEEFLSDTLDSIARQACDDYVVIVVGNQKPAFPLPPQMHFVGVNFPPPTAQRGAQTGMGPVIWDKGTKTGIGLAAAREFSPDFVMFFDADDYLHRDVARYVHDHPDSQGWVVRKGWMYSRARNSYVRRNRLFRICGTSFVVPFAAFEVPDHLTVSSTQSEVVDAFGVDAIEHVIGDHRYALEWWRARGRSLAALPFSAVVYHVDTGENHSGTRMLGPGLPYRRHLLEDFGIRSQKGIAATIWSAIGPSALKPDLRPRRPFFLKPRRPLIQRGRSELA